MAKLLSLCPAATGLHVGLCGSGQTNSGTYEILEINRRMSCLELDVFPPLVFIFLAQITRQVAKQWNYVSGLWVGTLAVSTASKPSMRDDALEVYRFSSQTPEWKRRKVRAVQIPEGIFAHQEITS
ncbi:hypothetical protein KIL84_005079 [Mauremys mutica]|uniref:Uncharacterized protein n=1 Tax=Mauremys mutica TaxID=74926 RepID=A0A9D3XK26_9SAUR|nr:hypothetical protein KIL84_005079 [Mauremys mutica]